MKRTALLLLTVIYIASCVGVSINRFYCCGKLASVSYNLGAAENGNKSAKKDQCCNHEKQSFKVKDNHFSPSFFPLNHPLPAVTPSFSSVAGKPVISRLPAKIAYKGNAPPWHAVIPVYTLNCTYRI